MEEITRAYLECALWASTDDTEGDIPMDRDHDLADLAPCAVKRAAADCARFLAENDRHIGAEHVAAGHDFWLTRNGHGAGFWDGDWPKADGEALTAAAHAFGECYLYVGDDGRIYFG